MQSEKEHWWLVCSTRHDGHVTTHHEGYMSNSTVNITRARLDEFRNSVGEGAVIIRSMTYLGRMPVEKFLGHE